MSNNSSSKKSWIVLSLGFVAFVLLLFGLHYIPANSLHNLGTHIPLSIFTFIVAIIDGFNPCNVFVLALFLGFLISASHSRAKIFMVGYTFVSIIFILYYLFMAAWLNLFQYVGFINPLRVTIAIFALIIGVINCKEMFFFKKGISLTIADSNKNIMYKKLRKMRGVIETGSAAMLFVVAVLFTLFVAMIELPCTAGFPIVYVGILTGKYMQSNWHYYLYLLLYNIVFILPAFAIVTMFGACLKSAQIKEKHVKVLKFIGGFVLLILGAILLVNANLII